MIHFDLPKQQSSIIKVIGVGGGGSNAVNYMFDQDIEGVDFIICNTDAKALEQSEVPNKIQLGPYLTQGLGAGANPEVGKNATEESVEEIRRILEVNTKMAFVTAGMGGGTGTGGAPIIAKICRELGILTVGIVTTPFGFEGPKRKLQAEAGIRELQPYVDTLLVISNDKLRMQFGNLKMREAFSKADNVLGTAAKCITDIINSRGHVIVDFADVCTVMKNGGVAILGSAAVAGEKRAQLAIEEALSSPLLNANDIRGAKWILININTTDNEYECTMDEVDIITSYVRSQAGENADVIVGMGIDTTLHDKIGITLIATGFDHTSAADFSLAEAAKPVMQKHIVTLQNEVATKPAAALPVVEAVAAPELQPTILVADEPAVIKHEEEVIVPQAPVHFELATTATIAPKPTVVEEEPTIQLIQKPVANVAFVKPTQVYANAAPTPAYTVTAVQNPVEQEDEAAGISLTVKSASYDAAGLPPMGPVDKEEEGKRKAQERLNKLRNLSFKTSADNELDEVPAYVRKNMELYGNNTLASAETYYNKYNVTKDENGNGQISTLNSFLDGKRPD